MAPVSLPEQGDSQPLKRHKVTDAEATAAAAPSTKPLNKNANSFDSQAEEWRSNLRGDAELVSGPSGERPDWWWTGPKPVPGAAGVQPDGTITSLPLPDLATCTRQQALAYFDNTWLITEVLFSALQGEECYYRPPHHNLRHPFIFYYGHVAVFYTNKLRVAGIQAQPLNLQFEHVFEVGVDEMSWDDLSKNDMLWPSVREVNQYRRQVYQMVRRHIETHPGFDSLPVTWSSPAWAFFMCFEHERIHIETSSVLMRELPAQQAGVVSVARKDEGHLRSELELAVPGGTAARARVSFRQMDPCCLQPDLGPFDAVLLSGVLERIPSPKAPLGRMAGPRGLLRKGGLLLVTSTYCWSERTAASQLWLGGTTDSEGNPVRSRDGLAAALGPDFELVEEADLPAASRSCERMYSVAVMHASLWRRVA